MVTQDSTGTDIIYSNEVSFKIEKNRWKTTLPTNWKRARGRSLSEAKKTELNKLKYSYKIIGNQLIFRQLLLTEFKNKYRDKEIEITL
jgi:hypothetical protein